MEIYTSRLKPLSNLNKQHYYVCRVLQKDKPPLVGVINYLDYRNFQSAIKPHEQVNKDKIKDYIHQFNQKGMLDNPIILFYRKFPILQTFINKLILGLSPTRIQFINGIIYQIWSINNAETVIKLQSYLLKITEFYVADGHHRIHALAEICSQSRANFPQMYLSFIVQEDDLELGSFNRFIKGIHSNIDRLLCELKKYYLIKKVSQQELDLTSNIYIYSSHTWHLLKVIKKMKNEKFINFYSENVDKFIISNLLSSSLTGKILYYPNTNKAEDILQFYHKNECHVAINIPALSLSDLYYSIEENHLLPIHSTYFTPKIPHNLFIQRLNFLGECPKGARL